MGGVTNDVMDISWRGPETRVWHVTYKGAVLYDADLRIDRMTPEAYAYLVSMEGQMAFEPFKP